MPELKELLKICQDEQPDPMPPSWCMVNYLLMKHEGASSIKPGMVVAASAECSPFSYSLHSIAPMYFNTIGGSERLRVATGYRTDGIRTSDADEAFRFIKDAIDEGKGVFVSGPETGICYGYEDNPKIKKRIVYGYTNWGPSLHGKVSWPGFSKYIQMFGNNEGLATLSSESKPGSKEEILSFILTTALEWQENHPAQKYGQKKEHYGLEAFSHYIDDLSNPASRESMDKAYINCHAIEFQAGGRYWLGQFYRDFATNFNKDIARQLHDISALYLKSHERFKKFIDFDILNHRNENEIATAVTWLKDAYQYEQKITEILLAIKFVFSSKAP